MILKLTFLNDEKHNTDFFGVIFKKPAIARPNKGETLISVTNEKYFVKDILVKTEEIEWCGEKKTDIVWDYQLKKLYGKSKRKRTASPSGNVHSN